MSIPANVILIWTGTNASIPAGWERVTALDGKYPKAWGDSVAPNNTGGSNTHTHTAASHGHNANAHTHSVSLGATNAPFSSDPSGSQPTPTHGHNAANIGGMSGGALQNVTITWASVNQEPPYHTVIFIRPSSARGTVGTGICSHFYGSATPTGWNYCNGSNSTPDLRNKYLKGAAGGGNAGTTGGGTAHSHTVTHGHTANSHTHSAESAVPNAQNIGRAGTSSEPRAPSNHTHTITLNASTDTVSNYTNTTAGSTDTVEVAYKKLGVMMNAGGAEAVGIIGLWLGATGDVPTNWNVCDGNNSTPNLKDKFIKIGASLANNDETGGANTHTHTAVTHTHTTTGTHTHTGSHGGVGNDGGGGGGGNNCKQAHTHALTIGTGTATYANTSLTSGSAVDNQPEYRTVAYIQLAKVGLGGAMLMSKLM